MSYKLCLTGEEREGKYDSRCFSSSLREPKLPYICLNCLNCVLIVLTKKKLLGILTIFVDLNSTPVSATVRGFLLQVMLMLLNTKL